MAPVIDKSYDSEVWKMDIIGIDAGGSKTTVMYGSIDSLIAEDSNGLTTLTLGTGNFRHLGADGVSRLIQEMLDRLYIKHPGKVAVIAGFAGAGTPESVSNVREVFLQSGFDPNHLRITSDVGLLLQALRNHGIVLISGTGSICMGRINGDEDRTIRAGGWGYRFGDAGSGYYIGLKAIETSLKIVDGMLPASSSTLFGIVREYFKLDRLDTITDVLYPGNATDGMVQEHIAGLAASVIDAATRGDRAAGAILDETAIALSECIFSVYTRLERQTSTVGLHGGVFKHKDADHMLIDRIKSQAILSGLPLNYVTLGVNETDPNPLVEAMKYAVNCRS